jgi:uncharacterized membrane protein YcfT
MPRVRIDWVDAARGVALTGVVLHHMVQATETDVAVNGGLATFDGVMDGLRMPTLIALSGILAVHLGDWSWRELLRRRVGPLLVMYASWAVVLGIVQTVIYGDLQAEAKTLATMFVFPVQELWYLLALAIYDLLAKATREVPAALLVAVAVCVFLGVRLGWERVYDAVGAWAWVLAHWVYFAIAQRYSAAYRRVAEDSTTMRALVALALFAMVGAAAYHEELLGSVTALLPLSIAGTFVSLACAGAWGGARVLGWARAIGRRSLGIYASHVVIGYALWALLRDDVPAFAQGGLVVPIALAAITLALSFLVQLALKRWAPVPLLRPWWDASDRSTTPVRTDVNPQAQ